MKLPMREIRMKSAKTALFGAAIGGVAIALSGCGANGTLNPHQTLTQGYVLDPEALELVPVGSSREQVELALGSPSTKATFDNETYYYISQTRVRNAAFQKPKLVDQSVLAIYFGDDDRVVKIAKYGLKDGMLFDFISRTTPTAGKERNFLAGLISGVVSGETKANPFGT